VTTPTQPSVESTQELARLRAELDSASSLDAAGFAEKARVPFASLGQYDPTAAEGMTLLQRSALALGNAELAELKKSGFVVAHARSFPSFFYGYASIYSQDLPLYISADSILYAVHQSYDAILMGLETTELVPKLDAMLAGMRGNLPKAGFSPDLQKSVDIYLTTAASLLTGQSVAPLDSANTAAVASYVQLANGASGPSAVNAFGVKRDVDFSQFKPRGHYLGVPKLEQYFRATIWLSRVDLRPIDTDAQGKPLFQRSQLEGAVALRQLMDISSKQAWSQIDAVVSAFVGRHDDMTPPEVELLMAKLGKSTVGELAGVSDTDLAQAIVDGGFGVQSISSQIVINGLALKTLPLARSFALLGQRYVFDSHVFSNVVFDRAQHEPKRMLPNPLDVAYAALGNNQAGMLLGSELEQYKYAPDLYGMRLLAQEQGPDFWRSNLYHGWLSALSTLSPSLDAKHAEAAGLPSVARTEAWGRRLLNTQLASWSELRHDTLLYAKQSYTSGASCSFPSAYVEPYPEFFAALTALAQQGATLVGAANQAGHYFDRLAKTTEILRGMAEHELQGLPLTSDELAFVNQTVASGNGCDGRPVAGGWYPALFYRSDKSLESDPSIADVHTQPTDEAGNDVGRVLHVATGLPELMVVTVDSCDGSHAYVGLASTYYEHTTEHYQRLTDPEWSTELQSGPPPRPAWLPSAFVR